MERQRLINLLASVKVLADGGDIGGVRRLLAACSELAPCPEPVGTPRVIIVDDNADAADSTAEVLRLSGYEADSVHGGKELIRRITSEHQRGRPHHVCVYDYHMPGMRGDEAFRIASAVTPLAGIALTADPSAVLQAIGTDTFAFLTKPAAPDQVVSAVRLAWHRWGVLSAARRENDKLRGDVESVRLVVRAKGLLARRRHMSEDEAHRWMQRESQLRGVPMRRIAEEVVSGS